MNARCCLLLSLLLTACGEDPPVTPAPVDYPDLVSNPPLVGAAEGTLKLPAGTPLAGFTARCKCLGGSFLEVDDRDSAYTRNFIESTGVHMRPRIKAVWVSNGDQNLVMTKADVIYSFDGMTSEITHRLERLTGEQLEGRVTFSGNHNHSSYGDFSDHVGLYLGGDRFNTEVFDRMADQIVQVAYEAFQNQRAAAIGVGWSKNWDPDNTIYSDRRGDNDGLVVWPDMGEEQWGKDPYLHVIRLDEAAGGDPIAVVMAWGMHPYTFGERSSLVTGDATAAVEDEVSEAFDNKVISMFLQTGGGDASVRGKDGENDFARMESVGLLARDKILALRESTPTSANPIYLEAFSRAVPMNLDAVRVTRGGAVNWYYPPYDPDRIADDVIYNEDGTIKSPIDEFNTDFGAAFCGSGDFNFPVGGLPSEAKEYKSCMNISLLSRLVLGFFGMTEEEVALPLHGMESAYTSAARMGPLPVRYEDGTEAVEDAILGFFPGEPLAMYTEQWRRRVRDEVGYRNAILFGYSQDHEGYLLIPEDWLRGGYEPDISFWGPLSGEYIMEQMIHGVDDILATDELEAIDPSWAPHVYPDRSSWLVDPPDLTPEAGARLDMATVPAYLWIPDDFTLDLEIPAQIPRITGMIQVAWKGGDPAVDDPRVQLERYDADTDSWAIVTTPTGRPVNEDMFDFSLAWTPDPLFPADAAQVHYWWANWQAVSHIDDRPGLELGTYRLHVIGKRATATTYPYLTAPYEVLSDAFEVVAAPVAIEAVEGGYWLSLDGPAEGFRIVDIEGQSRGHNPLRGSLTVEWTFDDGAETVTVDAGAPQSQRTWLAAPVDRVVMSVTVTDSYGNHGTWAP